MSVVRLSQSYPAKAKSPVIDAVDLRIFQLRYFRRCISCYFCADQCCSHGVDVDWANAKDLQALSPDFENLVGVPKSEWFAGPVREDVEFPSGHYVRTEVREGYCVFHDARSRGCKIQTWCSRQGIDHRTLKPMVSILFPITFDNRVLVPSGEALDASLICGGEGDSLFEGARDDLKFFFGRAFVEELDSLWLDQVANVELATGAKR